MTNDSKELKELAKGHIREVLAGGIFNKELIQVSMQTWNNVCKEEANEVKRNALRYAVATSMYETSEELKKILPNVLPEYSANKLLEE